MTKWTCLHVPRSDYWYLRNLGAETEWKGFRLWINATQARTRVFRNWLSKDKERRFAVDVMFDERDAAKDHGCFWCPDTKTWSFATCRADADLPAWVIERRDAKRVWLRTTFEMAPACKKAGCQWDGIKKMWYVRADRLDGAKKALMKYDLKWKA